MSRLSAYIKADDRRRVIAAEQARVRRVVGKFLANTRSLQLRPTSAAVVFLHDSVHSGRTVESANKDGATGSMILAASAAARSSVLLASLRALARAPMSDSSWEVNIICDLRFLHDHHWGRLISAILKTRLAVSDELMTATILSLSDLAARFDSNLPTNSYPFPFAAVIRFIDNHLATHPRRSVAPAVAMLLGSIRTAVANDLVSLKGYSAAEAPTMAAEPGKWFKKADREAIAVIEKWLPQHGAAA